MRKPLLAAIIFLSGSAAALAQLQPLNVRTGQWEVTEVTRVNLTLPPEMQARMGQLPPELRAQIESQFGGAPQTHTFKTCIRQADLSKIPFESPNQQCQWTVLSSTSSEMNVHGTVCRSSNSNGGDTGEVTVRIKVANPESATGDGQIAVASRDGGKMNGTYSFTSKWLGATCEP